MTTTPDTEFPFASDPDSPRWLGSAARRGLAAEHGAGWKEEEVVEEARPKWLGSVARRDGSRSRGPGWVEPEEAERPKWLGSVARRGDAERSLVLIDMESEPNELISEDSPDAPAPADIPPAAAAAPELAEILKPSQPPDELEERRPPDAPGELGMHLRVA